MFHRYIVVCIFATLISSYSFAQISIPDRLSLGDAIRATLESNPEMDRFPIRREILSGERETADLSPAFTLNSELENAFGSGELSGISGSDFTLAISNVIEMGDKREARVETVNRRIDILDAEQRVTELDLIAETTFRFIDVAVAQQRLNVQTEATELALQTRNLLQPLVDAGQAPQLEIVRADAAIRRAQIAQRNSEASLESEKIRLSTMWGKQVPEFDTVDTNFFETGTAGSLNSLLLRLETNPNIAIYADEARFQEARIREARSRQNADFQWSAGLRHNRALNDTGLVFSMSMPLNMKERSAGTLRSARSSLQEVSVRRESGLNTMRGELYALHEQLTQAISEAQVLQDEVLPLLTDLIGQTQQAYQVGLYSYVELISTQQEYLDAEFALINSLSKVHTLRAEIERLSGESLGSSTQGER